MTRPVDLLFFEIKCKNIGHHQFVYSPSAHLATKNLNAIILESCKGPIQPETIIIICPDESPEETISTLKQPDNQIAKDRISGRVPLLYASLDISRSSTRQLAPVFGPNNISNDVNLIIKNDTWIQAGLEHIFDEETVVHRAPPGYGFHKPSGGSSSYFLKPDLALSTSASISFVAAAVLRRAFPNGLLDARKITTIYVDTMAIAPVAFSAKELIEKFVEDVPSIAINSFHSYGGMDGVGNPIPETSLCLISASSSMSLHDKWIHDKSALPNQVATLLTVRGAHKHERALYFLDLPESPSEGPAELSIRIHGESFISANEVPKRVLLRREAHKLNKRTDQVFSLRKEGIFDAYTVNKSSPGRPRAIHVNSEKLLRATTFTAWLDSTLQQLLRANCRHIVHQEDSASALLAEDLAKRCEILGTVRPTCISASSVDSAELDKKAAIVVCAAVIGKGSALLQISRALRDLHDGPRLYLIGFQVSETQEEITTFVNNIRFRDTHPYDVATYGTLAIGNQIAKTYKREIDAQKNIEPSLAMSNLMLSKRAEDLGTSAYTGNRCFLYFGESADRQMNIRSGFAFWPPKYDPAPHQAEILATVAAILQRAREEKSLSDDNSLRSKTFRHVMIDPENFSRYNDGVIQAAILRSAFPSELDYRTDSSASSFMALLISRSVMKMDSEQGEAALEFLLAIYCKRLQLLNSDLDLIKESIGKAPVAEDVRKYMDILAGNESAAGETIDF